MRIPYLSPAIWWQVAIHLRDSHSQLVSNLGLCSLNTANVASRIFKQIPPVVGNGSKVWLSSMGIVGLDYYWNIIKKNLRDFHTTKHFFSLHQDFSGLFLTALKTAVAGVDALLCISGFGASLLSLAGWPVLARSLYQVLRLPGLTSLCAGIFLRFTDYDGNKKALLEITQLQGQPNKISQVFQETVNLSGAEKSYLNHPQYASIRIARQLGHFEVKVLQQELELRKTQGSNQELAFESMANTQMKNIQERLQKKLNEDQMNFGFTVLYYSFIAITRAYPDTLLQSFLNWLSNFMYTCESALKAYNDEEFRQNVKNTTAAATKP